MNEIKENSDYCVHCGKKIHEDDFPHHLKPGTILRNQYLVGNSIGEGGFGITYIGLDLSLDIKIAIKEFYPSGYANRNNTISNKVTLNYRHEGEYFKNGREHFLQEAKSIAKFHKETSIVDVMAFFEENDTAYIIMEYLDGLNLSEKVSKNGKFDAVEIFKLFIPMMKSLDKMHKEDIIHRDISPENIRILSDGTLKLMDFGSARYFAGMEKKTMSVQFKPGYAPFEQYNKNGNQGPWTDVYGLCATIYKCITGVTPIDSLERYQNDNLKKPSELGIIIPTSLEQILMYGLAIYPDNRCKSMDELISITESALRNEEIVLKNQTNSSDINDIYKTRLADEQYKTAVADSSFSEGFTENYSINNPNNVMQPVKPQKTKKPTIIIAVVLSFTLIIGGIIGFFIMNNSNNNNNSKNKTKKVSEQNTKGENTSKNKDTQDDISDKVTVSDVRGKKLSDARNELTGLGLKVETHYETSKNIAKGYIIRQSIEEGRSLNKGDTVMLYVSKGKSKSSGTSTSNASKTYYCCASDYATLRDRASRTGKEVCKIYSRESVDYISKSGDFYFVSYKGTTGYVLKQFFSKNKNAPLNYGSGNAPLKKNDTLYCKASDYATLRSSASRNSAEITRVYSREEVSYISSKGDFYYVNYYGTTGYVLKSYFDTTPNAPLNYGDN